MTATATQNGEITRAEPECLLEWRGHASGIAATATWTLTPRNSHSVLTHEFAGGGWMMFLSTLTGRAPRTAQKRLEGLKRVVESEAGREVEEPKPSVAPPVPRTAKDS